MTRRTARTTDFERRWVIGFCGFRARLMFAVVLLQRGPLTRTALRREGNRRRQGVGSEFVNPLLRRNAGAMLPDGAVVPSIPVLARPSPPQRPRSRSRRNTSQDISYRRLILHPHVGVYGRAENAEPDGAHQRRLRTGPQPQRPARQTAGGDPVVDVVLRPVPLDAALGAAKHRSDDAEILRRRPGSFAHVLETGAQLLAEGQGGDGGAFAE